MWHETFKHSQLQCSVESSFQYQQENNEHDAILLCTSEHNKHAI